LYYTTDQIQTGANKETWLNQRIGVIMVKILHLTTTIKPDIAEHWIIFHQFRFNIKEMLILCTIIIGISGIAILLQEAITINGWDWNGLLMASEICLLAMIGAIIIVPSLISRYNSHLKILIMNHEGFELQNAKSHEIIKTIPLIKMQFLCVIIRETRKQNYCKIQFKACQDQIDLTPFYDSSESKTEVINLIIKFAKEKWQMDYDVVHG
jgi:hypothetical protein